MDLDIITPLKLRALLGSVHDDTAPWNDLAQSLANVQTAGARITLEQLRQAAQLQIRGQLPIWWREDVVSWTVHKSQMVKDTHGYALPGPSGLMAVPLVSDRLYKPTCCFSLGTDFSVEPPFLIFREDPFLRVPQEPIFTGTEQTDVRTQLWLWRPLFERQAVTHILGRLWNYTNGGSRWAELYNLALNSLAEGGSQNTLEQMLSVVHDIPLTKTTGECVTHVIQDGRYQWVITDKHAYRHAPTAQVLVTPGQILSRGMPLSDGYHWIWPAPTVPADFPGLTLPKQILEGDFLADLRVENTLYAPQLGTPPETPSLQFPLQGTPQDVTRFWQLVAQREAQTGCYLQACFLAQGGIPGLINPLLFFLQHVFGRRVVVVWIKARARGEQALDQAQAEAFLRLACPARVHLLIEVT